MIKLGSALVMRWYTSELSGLPATTANLPGLSFSAAKAPASVSSRKFASRLFASGPWQAKHLSERMGRIWKL